MAPATQKAASEGRVTFKTPHGSGVFNYDSSLPYFYFPTIRQTVTAVTVCLKFLEF